MFSCNVYHFSKFIADVFVVLFICYQHIGISECKIVVVHHAAEIVIVNRRKIQKVSALGSFAFVYIILKGQVRLRLNSSVQQQASDKPCRFFVSNVYDLTSIFALIKPHDLVRRVVINKII